MATVNEPHKACTVNPLKMSQPLGACYAFMGMAGCMPVMHGSQGCTSFGLVLLVRHFREAIPLQTTAMNEVSTILGGMDNIEQAILNIKKRANPALIGIASTGLTETKGDDVDAYLKLIRAKHAETLGATALVYVSTPDYVGAFQDGWVKAVCRMIETLVPAGVAAPPTDKLVVLPGSHLTPGDIDELRDLISAFGLEAVVFPDLSGSMDGHVPDDFTPTTLGGTPLAALAELAGCRGAIAVGEQMRQPAELLQARTGLGYRLFDRLTGLAASDALISHLATLSGRPVPARLRRDRSRLVDAMLDGHFFFGGKRIALGAEPDLLYAHAAWLTEMGAEIAAAVTTTPSPVLQRVPCAEVLIGDLADLEARAADCDLLLTHAHGRQAAERLGLPLYRIGLPQFDRLGAAHRVSVGYRGSRELIFELANLLLANAHPHTPGSWPLPEAATQAARVVSM